MTKIVDAIMEKEMKQVPGVVEYRYFDPKLLRSNDTLGLVFVSSFQACSNRSLRNQ